MQELRELRLFPVEPILDGTDPAMRDYLRDRGLEKPINYPLVALDLAANGGLQTVSDSLLRRQLEFEGVSPLEAEESLTATRLASSMVGRLTSSIRQIKALNDGRWFAREIVRQQTAERRIRVLTLWRFSARWAIIWSVTAALALAIVTVLLARDGLALNPVFIIGGVLIALLTIVAGVIAWNRASQSSVEFPQQESAIWAQSLAAVEYAQAFAETQINFDEAIRISRSFHNGSTMDLGHFHRLEVLLDQLQSEVSQAFVNYRQLLLSAEVEARENGKPGLSNRAYEQLSQLDSVAREFGATSNPIIPALPELNDVDKRLNSQHDKNLATALAALFALVASSVILALPSTFFAASYCNYAIAEVRLESCEDLTKLKAEGLDLSGVDLAKRDVSEADFSKANLNEANMREAVATYSLFVDTQMTNVQATGADFGGSSLAGSDLSKSQLKFADFSGTDLSGATVGAADVSDSNFVRAFMADAKLNTVKATKSDFSEAIMTGVDLTGADLTGASFRYANLTNAVLAGAKLAGADFTGAVLAGVDLAELDLEGVIMDEVDLRGQDLSGLNLAGLSLIGANLSKANLSGASLENAILLDADLTDATFSGLKLAGAELGGVSVKSLLDGDADLTGVDLSGADFAGLSGTQISLENATLNSVNLEGFDLSNAVFDGSSLIGANLDGAVLTGASFAGANLSGASLKVSELSNATFSKANFSRADLTNARALQSDFSDATMTLAKLQGADFSNSDMRGVTGLGANAALSQWNGATCPNGQEAEICRS